MSEIPSSDNKPYAILTVESAAPLGFSGNMFTLVLLSHPIKHLGKSVYGLYMGGSEEDNGELYSYDSFGGVDNEELGQAAGGVEPYIWFEAGSDSTINSEYKGIAWTNYDILNEDDSLHMAASKPVYVGESDGSEPKPPSTITDKTIECGWTDYGENDTLSVTSVDMIQGWSVAGAWRCRVTDAAEGDSFTFEWYKDGQLISTGSGTSSDCVPSADEVGTFSYHCVISDPSGNSVTTATMTTVVKADDSGGDAGGDSGGSGGDDPDPDVPDPPEVTDITLTGIPDSVVPGAQITVGITVNGTGSYDSSYTIALSGNTTTNTRYATTTGGCIVYIGSDEKADSILITVTSVGDSTVYTSESIYITQTEEEEPTATAEQLIQAFWRGFAAGCAT